MEKPHAQSALKKFVKVGSESALPWSSAASARGMAKDEVKEQLSADKSKKPSAKENTKPVDVKLHTQQRAAKRAMFNYSVATKLYLMEKQKKHEEKLQKMIEEEEIRLLRKEMIPRAQLMPLFDRPFYPQRSSRPLTIPREPAFRMLSSKCWTCMYCTHQLYSFHQHCHPLKPIK
ncbi:protein TPX2 isoform X2 [Rhodamnia argentea]|uniref:Protein TPX2 isoform X2 n=1 Tax=Rhodamnia argentea TaxID=178133 RepID=A0ABM3HS68_9MYRT|nr:protein TPX2 isoform X2 [Rhodamnia argentea]